MSGLQLCEKNPIHAAMTGSLPTGSELVIRIFARVIVPVHADAVIVRRRRQLGKPPLRQVPEL